MNHAAVATRNYHPARHQRRHARRARMPSSVMIPRDRDDVDLKLGDRTVQLTNLRKHFWTNPVITKGDLLQYYADVAPVLLPHLQNRAMVMKRYPNGADGEFFFMKRAPEPRPAWIEICSIEHASHNVIHFPIIQDLPALLWVVNLGCIDLNQWYAPCNDVDRPDCIAFDLDPVPGASFEQVCETARAVGEALEALGMPVYAKTTGSRGIHIYVPIVRGPLQKQVWGFAKEFAHGVAALFPKLITAEYAVAKRPARQVLIDYNQNAWGRTLASVYSVRPRPAAPVSTPVTWAEIQRGIRIEDFRIDNVPQRIRRRGDLWAPLLSRRGRFNLAPLL